MKTAKFTYHARDKAAYKYGLGLYEMRLMVKEAVQIVPPYWVRRTNYKRYGRLASKVSYLMHEDTNTNFVILERTKYYLIVTVFRGEQPHARVLDTKIELKL